MRPDLIHALTLICLRPANEVDFVARGATPFGIYKLTDLQIGEMNKFQDALEQVSYVGIADIVKCNKKITRPVTGPHFFLEVVATFWALLLTLVGPTSPFYRDIDTLHNWAQNAYMEQKL